MKNRQCSKLDQAIDAWGLEHDMAVDCLLENDLDGHNKHSVKADRLKIKAFAMADDVFGSNDRFNNLVKTILS